MSRDGVYMLAYIPPARNPTSAAFIAERAEEETQVLFPRALFRSKVDRCVPIRKLTSPALGQDYSYVDKPILST